MYIPNRTHRTLITGRNGAVGTNQPLATQAGLDTLRAGGNAIDAAVAISLTLGVVEPGMSGLGGDGFYQVYTAREAASRCYNATGAAPLSATPERFRAAGIAVRGPLSVSTPGLPGGLGAMHAAHGRLRWRQLCGPAIEHARDGFAVSHHYRIFANDVRAVLAADPRSRAVFLAGLDVGVPSLAALITQPNLARTLEEIAQDGAESFYRGRLARRLAAGMREAGVLVDERDLEGPIAVAGPLPVLCDQIDAEFRNGRLGIHGFLLTRLPWVTGGGRHHSRFHATPQYQRPRCPLHPKGPHM